MVKTLGGEFSVTLDDTGRIALPRRLREVLNTDKVVVTKGLDTCLWLYSPQEWENLENQIVDETNPFDDEDRAFRRWIIGPNQELELDRQGRVLIPPTLRIFAKLNKDCIVLGQHNYVEIWALEHYMARLEESEPDFRVAQRRFGAIMKRKKNGTDSPRSGAAGTGSVLSGAEEQR